MRRGRGHVTRTQPIVGAGAASGRARAEAPAPLPSGGGRLRVTWPRPWRGGGWDVPGTAPRLRGARPGRGRSVEVLGGYGARERAASGGDRCRRGLTRAAGSWSHVFHHSSGTCRATRRRLGARAGSGGAEGVDTWVAGRPGRARTRGKLGDLGCPEPHSPRAWAWTGC